MGDDESVRKEVWEGRIPICFNLDDEEVGYSVTGERATPDTAYVSCLERWNYVALTKISAYVVDSLVVMFVA